MIHAYQHDLLKEEVLSQWGSSEVPNESADMLSFWGLRE